MRGISLFPILFPVSQNDQDDDQNRNPYWRYGDQDDDQPLEEADQDVDDAGQTGLHQVGHIGKSQG